MDQNKNSLITPTSNDNMTTELDITDETTTYKSELLELKEHSSKVQSDFKLKINELEERNIILQKVNSNLTNENKMLNSKIKDRSYSEEEEDIFDMNMPLSTILDSHTKDNAKTTNQMSCPLCVEHISDIMALRNKLRSLEKEIESSKGNQPQTNHSYIEKFRDVSLHETKLIQEKTILQDQLNKVRREISSHSAKNEELSRLYENLIQDNSLLTKKLMTSEERNCKRQESMLNDYNILNEKCNDLEGEKQIQLQKHLAESKLLKDKTSDLELLLEQMSQSSIQSEESNRKRTIFVQNENKRLKNTLSSLQLKYDEVNKLVKTLTQSYGEAKKENTSLKRKAQNETPNFNRPNNNFLKQVENIWQNNNKYATTTSMKINNNDSNAIVELKKANSDLLKELNGTMEKEKKLTSENKGIKSELADTKEALLSEIATMTDKVNDQDDVLKHYRTQVKELIFENRRLENGCSALKDSSGISSASKGQNAEVRE